MIAILPAILLGWLVVRALMPQEKWPSAWIQWVFEISLGSGLGAGLTSVVFFTLLWMGIASRGTILGTEAVLIGAAGFLAYRKMLRTPSSDSAPSLSWIWIPRIAGLVVVLLVVLSFREGNHANPAGEWDGFVIWNLKAKFLAGGAASWRNAFTLNIAAHPSYPLLLSAFVARTWMISGDMSLDTSAAISLLFTLAAAGVMLGAAAWARKSQFSEAAGLVAALIILATDLFSSQSAAQYADVPVAFAILASIALLYAASEREWDSGLLALSGIAAGLAAWTKNEGMPFLVFAALVLILRGDISRISWFAIGAAPGALVTLAFKMRLVGEGAAEGLLPKTASGAFTRLADFSRWIAIFRSYGQILWTLGLAWAHPLLMLAILAFTWKLVSRQDARSRWWFAVPVFGLLAVDFAIYLVTPFDLNWILSTSNDRLMVQVWPALVFSFFLFLQLPAAGNVAKKRLLKTK